MDITVRSLTGKNISISGLNEKMTVLELKEMVCDREGYPAPSFKLIYDMKRLQDEYTLA
jgi:hypothetical protein